MTRTTTTETVARLRSTQVIWPQWMADRTEGLAETDLVDVTRETAPFGTYVLAIVALPKPGPETSPLMLAGERLAAGETCQGCGSPGPAGECAMDCDWFTCAGCGFEGHESEHLVDAGRSTGYTGAPIYWATYACGHQAVDASRDVLEA